VCILLIVFLGLLAVILIGLWIVRKFKSKKDKFESQKINIEKNKPTGSDLKNP
jgi:flagellar biogenesis protein FliO